MRHDKDDVAKHPGDLSDRDRNTSRIKHQDKSDEVRYPGEVSERDRNMSRFKHQSEDELKTRSGEEIRKNDQVIHQVLVINIYLLTYSTGKLSILLQLSIHSFTQYC